MKKLLWLDDVRDPYTNDWLVFSPIERPFEVIWIKSYIEFIEWISKNGLPDAICFDHDLGEDENGNIVKSGFDCTKWLVDYCIDNNKDLPKWNIQSQNPIGKDNINGMLMSYLKHGK